MPVQVGERIFSMLADTGASCNVFKMSSLPDLHITPITGEVVGPGGEALPIAGTANVSFCVLGLCVETTVMVATECSGMAFWVDFSLQR